MVTVTLKKPVEHNGQTYTAVEFNRESEVGDLLAAEAMGGGQLAQTIAILASISGVPLPAFRKITARDLARIMGQTEELLGNEPADTTGA